MRRRPISALLGSIAILAACGDRAPKTVAAKSEITIAAAANLMDVFGELGPRFEAQTGIHPVVSFGSTAQLSQQIENSAPFDVFAAADAEHIAELDRKGLLAPHSHAVYALGVLALWVPPGSKSHVSRLDQLVSPGVRVIAIANPELAPYGKAALNLLEKRPDWRRIKPKIVYAENISMATQYGKSNNADVVFTAYSLVLHEGGTVIQMPGEELPQEIAILANSRRQEEARKFVTFLLHGDGREILNRYGYHDPPENSR
jgi:molybdate transport system substrate-binding protein